MLGFQKVARRDAPIGEVTHFYGKLGVAIVKFNREMTAGKNVTFQGRQLIFSRC